MQHVLEGGRHGGGLCDSGSGSSDAVMREVGAIEGLRVVAQVLSGLVQESVIQATHGRRHRQRRGSIVGLICVVSKRIVKVSLLLGGTAGRVAFDNHGQGASWTIIRCIWRGLWSLTAMTLGRGDKPATKPIISLIRRHARLGLPRMYSPRVASFDPISDRVNAGLRRRVGRFVACCLN
jgi:hypothetical protein